MKSSRVVRELDLTPTTLCTRLTRSPTVGSPVELAKKFLQLLFRGSVIQKLHHFCVRVVACLENLEMS